MALSLQRYTWSFINNHLNQILKERSKKERQRSRLITIEYGDILPENVVIEILSWLPVKNLLQFKSVSKSWYAIISSPNFVSKHLNNYYNNNDAWRGCLLAQYYVSQAELQLLELLVDETPKIVSFEVLYDMPRNKSLIQGPCNGIYCQCHYDLGARALWNPAINELRVLPPIITKHNLPSNIIYAKYEVYGFGLDPMSKDYKVVVIKGYANKLDGDAGISRHPVSVLVYSFGTDSWRYWGDLAHDYSLVNNTCYVCVDGAFYWLGIRTQDDEDFEVIVKFDMVADACQEIQVPDYEKPASKSLGLYHDCVACFAVHERKSFSIWSLTAGIWTKKFIMETYLLIRSPIGHWMDNKIILEADDDSLVVCDPETRELHNLAFKNGPRFKGIYAYMESLVSLKNSHEQVNNRS